VGSARNCPRQKPELLAQFVRETEQGAARVS